MVRMLLCASAVLAAHALPAQTRTATASRSADLQAGVEYLGGASGYDPNRFTGYGGYVTLDFREHWGADLNIKQYNTLGEDQVYERTYQIGLRYVRHYSIFDPYLKGSVGRGVYNFPNNVANLAYNMYSGALGTDVHVARRYNLRIEAEYQQWPGFPPKKLAPAIGSLGVAYHFGQ